MCGVLLCCLSIAAAQDGKAVTANSREVSLQKRYLNFPVKNKAAKRLISLVIDEKVVREFEIELAPEEPDFWVFLDVSEFRGDKAILRTDKYDPVRGKRPL